MKTALAFRWLTVLAESISVTVVLSCSNVQQIYRENLGEALAQNGTSLPLPFGKVTVDRRASELAWTGIGVNEEVLKEVREGVALAMEDTFRTAGETGTARFNLEVKQNITNFILLPCLVVLMYLGCPMNRYDYDVSVQVDIGGKMFSGTAKDRFFQFMYYHPVKAQYVVIASAFKDAFSRADDARLQEMGKTLAAKLRSMADVTDGGVCDGESPGQLP